MSPPPRSPQVVANKSTYWVAFELLWRDYYRFFSLKHGARMFHAAGTRGERGRRGGPAAPGRGPRPPGPARRGAPQRRPPPPAAAAPAGQRQPWVPGGELFDAWREGRTGMPLVDANMRELAATGFMSNRGRQNVASYLVHDLGVDWRRGGDWFEHLLVDYDVASNWGNWVAAAGLTGGRVNRFNVTKQSHDYDPDGDYVRHWLPELRGIPGGRVHAPWQLSKEDQDKFGVAVGVDYPAPVRGAGPFAAGGGGGRGGPGGARGRGGGGRGREGRAANDRRRRDGDGPRDRRERGGGGRRNAPMSEFDRFG